MLSWSLLALTVGRPRLLSPCHHEQLAVAKYQGQLAQGQLLRNIHWRCSAGSCQLHSLLFQCKTSHSRQARCRCSFLVVLSWQGDKPAQPVLFSPNMYFSENSAPVFNLQCTAMQSPNKDHPLPINHPCCNPRCPGSQRVCLFASARTHCKPRLCCCICTRR